MLNAGTLEKDRVQLRMSPRMWLMHPRRKVSTSSVTTMRSPVWLSVNQPMYFLRTSGVGTRMGEGYIVACRKDEISVLRVVVGT